MNKEEFKIALEEAERARDRIDNYIWEIFYRYIDDSRINFRHPHVWEKCDENILFLGKDGCMGCYGNMSLEIPVAFFEDYEREFQKAKGAKDKERRKQAGIQKAAKTRAEKAQYVKLKNKYG